MWCYRHRFVRHQEAMDDVDLGFLNLRFVDNEPMTSWQSDRVGELRTTREQATAFCSSSSWTSSLWPRGEKQQQQQEEEESSAEWSRVRPLALGRWREDEQRRLAHLVYSNEWRCAQRPLYGLDLRQCVRVPARTPPPPHLAAAEDGHDAGPPPLVLSHEMRALAVRDLVTRFTCIITPARAPPPLLHCSHPRPSDTEAMARTAYHLTQVRTTSHHPSCFVPLVPLLLLLLLLARVPDPARLCLAGAIPARRITSAGSGGAANTLPRSSYGSPLPPSSVHVTSPPPFFLHDAQHRPLAAVYPLSSPLL
jgi:hypothetical protein